MKNSEWFQERWIKEIEKTPAVFLSVDSPNLVKKIILSHQIIYIRLHGRTEWYSHNYMSHESKEIINDCRALKPEKIFAFLIITIICIDNAQYFYRIIQDSV